eukprot:5727711-Pleurochrysis_carterae.AAC.5
MSAPRARRKAAANAAWTAPGRVAAQLPCIPVLVLASAAPLLDIVLAALLFGWQAVSLTAALAVCFAASLLGSPEVAGWATVREQGRVVVEEAREARSERLEPDAPVTLVERVASDDGRAPLTAPLSSRLRTSGCFSSRSVACKSLASFCILAVAACEQTEPTAYTGRKRS